jgi:signal transduction histidine kinase
MLNDVDVIAPVEENSSLITIKTTPVQRRIALIVGIVITGLAGFTLYFAKEQWTEIEAFIPIFITIVFLADLVTAFLFFSQFLVDRHPAVMVLSASYLFSSLITIPYLLSFPGVFSETGLLGGNSQTTNWIWIFWHVIFPVGILIYLIIDKTFGDIRLNAKDAHELTIWLTLGVICLVLGLSSIAYWFNSFLPAVIEQGNYTRINTTGIGPAIFLFNAIAFAALVYRTHGRTVVQLWLSLALLAWMLNVLLTLAGGTRFSAGWYMSRVNTVFTSGIVLSALLFEINQLYYKLRQTALENARLYRQTQEALQTQKELDRLKDQFMSIASHELRTPITSIKGFSQILQRNLSSITAQSNSLTDQNTVSKQLRSVENIIHQVNRMNELIGRLLDFSRIENGQLQLNLTPEVNLTELARRVIEQQSTVNDQHQLQLKVSNSPIFVTCDEARLEQVLNNLVSNAIKYSPSNTLITIGVEECYQNQRLALPDESRQTALIWVRDQGYGISPEDQARLFERFFRVRSQENTKIEGLGLGLYISHEIVSQHGGQMWVESEPGAGSTFYVALPVQTPARILSKA